MPLEIDLTLTVAGLREIRLREAEPLSSAIDGACPLDNDGPLRSEPNCQGALVAEPCRHDYHTLRVR